jgi:hypothetical protein
VPPRVDEYAYCVGQIYSDSDDSESLIKGASIDGFAIDMNIDYAEWEGNQGNNWEIETVGSG